MATYNDKEVEIDKDGKCYLLDNTERKFGSSDVYFAVSLTFNDQVPGMGKELPNGIYLFTHLELAKAHERSERNPEDLPKSKNWFTRLFSWIK